MVRVVFLLALCGCDQLFGIAEFNADADADTTRDTGPDANDPRLVAYYPMDDLRLGLTCMHDAVGGHDGVCANGMPTLVPGRHGRAYQFDGVANITVPEIAVSPTPPFTITMWLEITSPLSTNISCAASRVYSNFDADSWQICVSSGTVYYIVGTGIEAVDGTSMTIDTWHHLAVTYADGMWQGWLDGQSGGQQTSTVLFDNQPMVVGVDIDSGAPVAPYFNAIDDLSIYNVALDGPTLAMLAQM